MKLWFARLLLRSLAWMSLPRAHALGSWVGQRLYRRNHRSCRIARANLAACFPDQTGTERDALLQDFMAEFGKSFAEAGWLWHAPVDEVLKQVVEVSGKHHLAQAADRETGLIVLSPHLGAFELLNFYLARQITISVLYREAKDPALDRLILNARARSGATMLQADASAVRHMLRTLRAGEAVGILPDQLPKRGQGEFAPFFNQPALTMTLASRLAHKTGAKVVFAVAWRLPQGAGYRVEIVPAASAIASDNSKQAATALNAGIEKLVARNPSQYQWGYKRFGVRPEGYPSVYET